ncbi:integrase core domain protein [Lasius niger]|uniref:Integrase core domain protein n=1 Tax=Lasius niger TaxID=67767 RepID=A0A0J7KNZ2_LASNI|nr:integrase core domain protein [Lasius niger]
MDSELIKINKLKSVEDWTTWKFQIKVMMIANECFEVANGTVTKPELPNQNANAEIRAAYQKDLKQWLKLDGIAQKLIALDASEQSLLHIMNCESAHQMWNKLQSIYKGACYKCGKFRHFQRNCRSKIKENKNEKEQQNSTKEKQEALYSKLVLTSAGELDVDVWYLDSGASSYMTGRRDWFKDYKVFQEPTSIKIGNGVEIAAHGKGHINVSVCTGSKWEEKYLKDVIYVPKLAYNLFSMGSTLDKQMKFESNEKECRFVKGERTIALGRRKGRLYAMQIKVIEQKNALCAKLKEDKPSNTTMSNMSLWHEGLTHQNFKQIRKILKKAGIVTSENDPFCKACAKGKACRKAFPKSATRTRKVAELIHADLCGPMETNLLGGAKYFLLFKDDYSGYRKVYFLKTKEETIDHFKNFIKRVQMETRKKINTLRTDNGLEFVNKKMKKIMMDEGIEHQTTVPYTPEQNGKAERENRTITEAARTMFLSKDLPKLMWAEAVNTAVHIINITGKSGKEGHSPYEIWFSKDVTINYLKVFGTKCHVHIPKQNRKKWDAKSKEGILVGYDGCTKGYKIWFPETRKVETHRDVTFEAEQSTQDTKSNEEKDEEYMKYERTPQSACNEEDEEEEELEGRAELPEESEHEEKEDDDDIFQDVEQQQVIDSDDDENLQEGYTLRDRRTINPLKKYGDYYKHGSLVAAEREEKICYEEYTKILDNKWVLKTKLKSDGTLDRYKARLVVRGFRQEEGRDYDEIFSPVARFESIRVILALAASEKMHKMQLDIKTAFLNGTLEENIYMRQPQGFENGTKKVC